MFEELLKILTSDELITVRAEKALVRLLDFDPHTDPNGEAWKLWNSLMCDVNQTICGGETLDPRWAQEVVQKILRLFPLTHIIGLQTASGIEAENEVESKECNVC